MSGPFKEPIEEFRPRVIARASEEVVEVAEAPIDSRKETTVNEHLGAVALTGDYGVCWQLRDGTSYAEYNHKRREGWFV